MTLEDPSPAGESFEHVQTSEGRCTIDKEGLRCSLGTVAKDGSVLIQMTATVAAGASGPIVNLATVWGNKGEANESNNTARSTVLVTPPPGGQPVSDLALTKHVDRPAAAVGEYVRYAITVTNKGPEAARSVRATGVLKLPVRVLSIHPRQGHCQTGPPITCALKTLDAGAHTTITIVVVLTVAGEETNTAGVVSQDEDPKPANNVAAANTRTLAARRAARRQPPRVTG